MQKQSGNCNDPCSFRRKFNRGLYVYQGYLKPQQQQTVFRRVIFILSIRNPRPLVCTSMAFTDIALTKAKMSIVLNLCKIYTFGRNNWLMVSTC